MANPITHREEREIRRLHAQGMSIQELCIAYHRSQQTIEAALAEVDKVHTSKRKVQSIPEINAIARQRGTSYGKVRLEGGS
jgi:IS30 family transposase